MRKTIFWILMAAGWAFVQTAPAGMLTGSSDALMSSASLDPLSVGAFYQQSRRDVRLAGGGEVELRARSYGGLLGLDVFPWLTLYGTAGAADARFAEFGEYGDDRFAWTAGLNLGWWEWEGYGEMPVWRLNIKTRAEAGRYRSVEGGLDIEWMEYNLSFPVGYEVLFARHKDSFSDIHHMELYAGPALSWVDGEYEIGRQKTDFDEDTLLGVVAGATLYVTETFFVGLQGQYYDRFTVGGLVGYSFR